MEETGLSHAKCASFIRSKLFDMCYFMKLNFSLFSLLSMLWSFFYIRLVVIM